MSFDFKRSFIQRTFSSITPGGVRGNIFLFISTSIGSSFFLLPYTAKISGLVTILIFLLLAAFFTYFVSVILYLGFEYTKASSYSSCMESILGKKLGLFSSLVIFAHLFGGMMALWMFSFKFLSNGIYTFFELQPSTEA